MYGLLTAKAVLNDVAPYVIGPDIVLSSLGQKVPAIGLTSALSSALLPIIWVHDALPGKWTQYRIPNINWADASTLSVSMDAIKRSPVIRFSKLAETVRAYRSSLPSRTQQKHGTGGEAMNVWKT